MNKKLKVTKEFIMFLTLVHFEQIDFQAVVRLVQKTFSKADLYLVYRAFFKLFKLTSIFVLDSKMFCSL